MLGKCQDSRVDRQNKVAHCYTDSPSHTRVISHGSEKQVFWSRKILVYQVRNRESWWICFLLGGTAEVPCMGAGLRKPRFKSWPCSLVTAAGQELLRMSVPLFPHPQMRDHDRSHVKGLLRSAGGESMTGLVAWACVHACRRRLLGF